MKHKGPEGAPLTLAHQGSDRGAPPTTRKKRAALTGRPATEEGGSPPGAPTDRTRDRRGDGGSTARGALRPGPTKPNHPL